MQVLVGIAIGLTPLVVLWLVRVPSDVRRHDRLVAERDEDLATWIADEKIGVDWELKTVMDHLAARNLLNSGERNFQRARAKREALHAWRDQERLARRFCAELEGKENGPHVVWRWLWRRPFPSLTAPERARPILDFWRAPETFENAPVLDVEDPSTRSLDDVIEDMRAQKAA